MLLACLSGAALADFSGKVVGVHDGDTLTVLNAGKGQKVRLVEIDAPESRQDFGQASQKNLSDLCFGKEARVQDQGHDKYGRVLGRVSCGGVDANLEQVKKGLAWFYVQYGHDEAVRAAESEAKAAGLGLWAKAGAVPPWEYRHGGQDRGGKSAPIKAVKASGTVDGGGHSGEACGGKSRCGDMSSCAEAKHYLNDCGQSQLDRDHDGVPCESICGR